MIAAPELPDFLKGGVNLASAGLGAVALSTTDDFFAPVSRMLADNPAEFFPDRYDDNGKWMDGWESRRRRGPGHDWAVVRLAAPGRILGFDVDTAHFTGNFPPACLIEGWWGEGDPEDGAAWTPLTAHAPLGPSAHHFLPCIEEGVFTHVRLHMFPDGGVARLRVYGQPQLRQTDGEIDLGSALNGARVIGWSNAHYGDIQRVLFPGRPANMGDGWETRRLRTPGHDWMVVKLAARGVIARAEVDTCFNKGNFPDSCSFQAADMGDLGEGLDQMVVTAAQFWDDVAPKTRLAAASIAEISFAMTQPVTHVRFNIHPDGGVARLRLWGRPA
jgi:allantoicase